MRRLLLLFGVVSWWISASAQCPPSGPLSTPYFEDFTTINNGATGNTFNNCWVSTTSTDPNWESEKSGTGNSSSTGPDVDNSIGFANDGYYVYLETSSGSQGDTSGFMSPTISLSGLSSPELSFYYHMYGADMGELEVQVWNGTQWDSVWAISGEQQTSETAPWRWANVSLASYSGNIKIKFLGSKGGSSFYGDMSIDDIRIAEATGCIDSITNGMAKNITAFAGDVVWDGNAGATSWEVHYYETGTDFYNGTTVTTTTDSVHLTGLQSDTEYRVFIREACSGTGFGPWSPAHKLQTPVSCPAPSGLTENATTATTADLSWTTGGATSWIIEYDTIGFAPGTGTMVVANSSTNFILSGLTTGSRYDVYVRDFCMAGDTSAYVGPIQIMTDCNALTAPYSTGFENDLLDRDPLCWSSYNTGSSSFVEVENFTGTNAPYAGSQALYLYSSSATAATDTVLAISPQFSDLTAGDKQIRFQTSADDTDDTLFIGTVANPSPTATFTPVDTVVYPAVDTYSEVIIPMNTANGYNGTDEYIVFVHNLGGTYDYIRIDDFAYEQIPSCTKVTNITLDSVSAFAATFSFTANGNTFDYEWGPTGYTFGQATATTGQVTGNPATVTGFQPATTYDIYLRNNCGTNGVSVWEGPFTFTTACYYVAPFFENFEGYTAGQNGPNISGCLKGDKTSRPSWETEDSEGQNENSLDTGPFYDNTSPSTAGGKYLFLECSGGSLGDSSYITSPAIDVSALNVPYFTMAYHMYGQTMGTLKVQYSDGTNNNWKPLIELTGEQQTAGSDPWKTIGGAMQNLTSDTIYFRIIGYRGSNYYSDMSIDDLSIVEAPSCIPSSFLTLATDSTTSNSAFVSWTPGSGAGYEVEWGPTGYSPGGGIGSATVVDTFYTITGLSPATTYDIYVRDSCNGSYSTFTGPVTVSTQCLTASMPYYESFDNWPLTCWTQSGNSNWVEDQTNSPDNYAMADFYSNSTGVYELNTSAISITQDAQVRFKWSHQYSTSYPNDELQIRAQIVGTGVWNTILSLTGPNDFNDAGAGTTSPGSFTETSILLDPAIYTGQDVIIQIKGISDWGPHCFVNDFYVEDAPACPDPFGVTAHSILDTSVVLDWGVSPSYTSSEVWFGPQGFYQGTQTPAGMGARSTTTADSLIVDTLSPKTCYEYVVRGICGAGDTTTWVGPFQFCTPCTPFTAPYSENFDGTSPPSVDACWTVINNSTSTFGNLGTSTLYSVSSPNSIEMYYYTSPGDMILVSPLFSDMDNQKRVRFQVYDEDDAADLYIGTMSNPSDASTFTAYDTITAIEMPDEQWDEIRYLFSDYTGNDKYIAIARSTTSILTKVFIDDFVYEAPTCFEPTNLTSTASTTTSITLDWTTGGASNWQIEYGPTGFTPGTGTILNVGTNPYTVTGLTQATVYDFYVSDSCGVGDISLSTGPLTVQTPCTFSLSGSYTIGASGGYATLDSIVNDLNLCGVSGPVTVNMGGGTHGPISLGNIPGATATNTVTFMGSAGLGDTISGNGTNFAVELDNAGHVIFDGVYLQNTTGNFVVWMHNNANNISIDNCYLEGSRTATSSLTAVIASSNEVTATSGTNAYGDNANNISITNNTIAGNYYGVVFNGISSTDHISGLTVSDNDFEDQYYYGIRAYYVDSVEIHNNSIPDFRNTSSYGLYMYYNDIINVTGNYVGNAGTYGMYFYYANRYLSAAPSTSGLVANNMFNGGTAGIYSYSPRFVNFYHNTIQGNTYGMYLSGSTSIGYEDINVKNNIFAQVTPSTSTLSAAFSNSVIPTGTYTLDNNLYYSPNGNIGYQSGTGYATLALWQAGQSSYNVNSVEGDPLFYSATDLHVLGSLANDAGDNTLGITVDIDGDPRPASGSTIVDIGADEYTPVAGDLDLFAGDFQKEFFCLSSADTIVLQVKNILGSAVDFTVDPLTATYNVTGPVNSSGTITQNAGTLAAGDTLTMMATTIDLSIPGTYTLNAYIDSNAVNNLSYNDTLITVTIDVDSVFTVNPSQVTLISTTDSAELKANSPFFGGGSFMFTEICHYRGFGTGAGTSPAYLTADDYIEITGIPGADLGGLTLEVWTGTSASVNYTFPQGTLIGPNGTALIMHGQGATASQPANFLYDGRGTYTGSWSSGSDAGYILKDGATILDAVTYDAYTFPAAAGVTANDWTGQITGTSGTAGIRLIGPDNNLSSDWTVVSAATTQDAQVANANVPLPAPTTATGFTWSLNGVVVDSVPTITVRPATPGSHWYVATYVSPCGITYTDSVEVIVPSCLPPSGLAGSALSTSSVSLSWDTTGVGAASYEIEYGAAGFTPGTGTVVTSTGNSTSVTGLAANLCQEFYLRAICGPNDNSPWIGPITVCPEATICTDDIEPYAVGDIDAQSALFIGWQGGAAGDATVSTNQSSSGAQAMRVTDQGTAATADVVAYFDTISAGAWEVSFDMYVASGDGAYFNIQQNHDLTAVANQWNAELYFQPSGTAQVQHSASSVIVGTFSYTQAQWFTMSAVIDLSQDTIWFEVDGNSTGIGFQYSAANPGQALQFNGVNFYTGVLTGVPAYNIDYYVDDFCVSPYVYQGCNAPVSLAAANMGCDSVELSWTSLSGANNSSIIEYGPAGFTPGSGTFVSYVNSATVVNGLTPGTAYDFYVADTCGTNDTSAYAGPVTATTLNGPKPVASFTYTVNGFTVNVDASGSTNGTTYDWDFGDGNNGSGVNTSNTYGTGGSYTITLVVSNACGTDDTTITVNDINLVENTLARSLTVYPNPAKDVVSISFANASTSDAVIIRVLDLSGKEISVFEDAAKSASYEENIDISQLAKGVYMLEISNGALKANKRLVKH